MNLCPYCNEKQKDEDLVNIENHQDLIIKTFVCNKCNKQYNEHYPFSHYTNEFEKYLEENI